MRRRPAATLTLRTSLGGILVSLSALIVSMGAGAAKAETLAEALAAAYLFNPTLKAARAQLRATDEEVAVAKSGYRPTITGDIQHSYQYVDTQPPTQAEGDTYPRSYSLTLNQPIFRGFQTINAVRGAEALVEAGREDLRSSEQTVLLDAITFYVNVVRDAALLELQLNNLKVLTEQERATKDRFDVGEVTRTDVAQAEARRADSRVPPRCGPRQPAHQPRQLPAGRRPSARGPVVAGAAGAGHPQVAAGRRRHLQQREPAGGGRALPRAGRQVPRRSDPRRAAAERAAGGELYDRFDPDRRLDETEQGIVTGRPDGADLRGGRRLRARAPGQAEPHRASCSRSSRSAPSSTQTLVAAWSQLEAARAQVESDRVAVESNKVALQGVREEEKVGQRTLLDVLNAEQELLNSQVLLTTSRRDLVVASYSLLSTLGRISAYDLELQVEQYDPSRHYGEVRDKWFGWRTSYELTEAEPTVAPVTDPGRTPGQAKTDGPAYTVRGWSARVVDK